MAASTTLRVLSASSESPTTDLSLDLLCAAALALSHAVLALASLWAAPGGGATTCGGCIAMIPAASPVA